MPKHLFTEEEVQRIKQTVQEAESACGAEIVPVFTQESSAYETAWWRGGFMAMLTASLLLITCFLLTSWLLFAPPYLWLGIVFTAGLLTGLLVENIPAFKRKLISKTRMRRRVLDQAKNMFYDYRIADTEQRTGILLFISFFERQAVILADIGIAEVVEEKRWEHIMHTLVQGIKQQRQTESICQAVMACARLVEESGIQRTDSDQNELPDNIQFE